MLQSRVYDHLVPRDSELEEHTECALIRDDMFKHEVGRVSPHLHVQAKLSRSCTSSNAIAFVCSNALVRRVQE
jgi:hypothetical protein